MGVSCPTVSLVQDGGRKGRGRGPSVFGVGGWGNGGIGKRGEKVEQGLRRENGTWRDDVFRKAGILMGDEDRKRYRTSPRRPGIPRHAGGRSDWAISVHCQNTTKLCFSHTAPTVADDSSPHRARGGVKSSSLHSPLLGERSLPSLSAGDALRLVLWLETSGLDPFPYDLF